MSAFETTRPYRRRKWTRQRGVRARQRRPFLFSRPVSRWRRWSP